jgi:hypothetical protein
MTQNLQPPEGVWIVRRERGVLPPGRIVKSFVGTTGTTRWLGARFAFDVSVDESTDTVQLRYRRVPVVDTMQLRGDAWHGVGRVMGVPFCGFRLDRV